MAGSPRVAEQELPSSVIVADDHAHVVTVRLLGGRWFRPLGRSDAGRLGSLIIRKVVGWWRPRNSLSALGRPSGCFGYRRHRSPFF